MRSNMFFYSHDNLLLREMEYTGKSLNSRIKRFQHISQNVYFIITSEKKTTTKHIPMKSVAPHFFQFLIPTAASPQILEFQNRKQLTKLVAELCLVNPEPQSNEYLSKSLQFYTSLSWQLLQRTFPFVLPKKLSCAFQKSKSNLLRLFSRNNTRRQIFSNFVVVPNAVIRNVR